MTDTSQPTRPLATGPGAPATDATDADWPAHEAAAKDDAETGTQAPRYATHPTERREPGHIDSALESLGEAISDPVREAAEEMSEDVSEDTGTRPAPSGTRPAPASPEQR